MTVDQGSSVDSSSQTAPSQDAQSAVVSALQNGAPSGEGTGQGSAQTQQSQPAAPAQSRSGGPVEGSGLVNPFLENVDAADRAVVEKYIKDWDSGVTKKFQELHGQLSPYQELGDTETLTQAVQLMDMIDSDPQTVLNLLQQALGDEQGQEDTQGLEEQASGDDPMSGLPPKFVEQFNQMQQVLEMLAGDHIEQRTTNQQKEEDAQLDQTLTALKEKHGDFDEDYILAKMSIGMDPEKAVEAYQNIVQGQVNKRSATPNIPPILGGGGAAPQGGKDIKEASSKDVKKLVADLLKNNSQA